jgi:RNA polymerase sigma-70 factor (ECF subfamily)
MQAIMQLNEDQRVVILLHDAEGYTLDEVSNILQTPLGTLKSRLHRGRNRVKELTLMELSECQQRDSS